MTTETTLTCKRLMGLNGYHVRTCGKKVKGQTDAGEWLCGVHLGAYNRVKKNRAAEQAQWDENHAARNRAMSVRDAIAERYGLEGRVFVSHNGTYTGEIVISGQRLFEILTKLTTK